MEHVTCYHVQSTKLVTVTAQTNTQDISKDNNAKQPFRTPIQMTQVMPNKYQAC